MSSSVEQLNAEIDRLTRELDQASSEKVQSAQYGLVLLEEKGHLEHKCEELESLYDNAKHELEITQEVSVVLMLPETDSTLKFACTELVF